MICKKVRGHFEFRIFLNISYIKDLFKIQSHFDCLGLKKTKQSDLSLRNSFGYSVNMRWCWCRCSPPRWRALRCGFFCSSTGPFSFIVLLLLLTLLQSTDCTSSNILQDQQEQEREEQEEDTRPNILLLLTDDQDVMIGGLDKMSNLQNLLQRYGTTFSNAFVHTPICCPSRCSIYTGRYLHNGGALDNSVENNCNGYHWQNNAELHTFAVYAKNAGFVTSFAGKYLNGYGIKGSPHCHDHGDEEDVHDSAADNTADHHHHHHDNESGCTRVPPGWDKWLGLIGNSQYYDYGVVHYENDNNNNNTNNASAAQQGVVENHANNYDKDYFPDLVANFTLKQMKEHFIHTKTATRKRRPILAVTAWPTAHMPFTQAPWAENMYNNISAHRTPNYNASVESLHDKHWMMRWLAPIDHEVTAKWINQVYENRTEALQSVDQHIAQFIDLLQQYDEYNNTIIIYTSDNGWQLGQHRLSFDKRQLYEHDIRVPFIVSGPGIPQNVTNPSIVLNIDIAPTIYHLVTGINPSFMSNDDDNDISMDGESFLPLLLQHFSTTRTMTKDDDTTTTIDKKDTKNSSAGSRHHHDDLEHVVGQRNDFLVSYHGEGIKQCGNFWQCPIPKKKHYHMGDWINNTYHCVRTIRGNSLPQRQQPSQRSTLFEQLVDDDDDEDNEDSIYCRFDDDESFIEYYDLIVDPWQLHNAYNSLTLEQRLWYDDRLRALQSCKGQSCRVPSTSKKPTSSISLPVVK